MDTPEIKTESGVDDSKIDDKVVESAQIVTDTPSVKGGKNKPKRHFTDILSRSEFLMIVLVLLITSLIRAAAVVMFANPNKLSLGGITGIGTILYNALGWNISITTFVMNVPLLILAFFFINKRFALLTLLSTLMTSGFMELFTDVLPTMDSDPFVAAVMSGAMSGVAIGFMLRANCSSGGTDIIGILIQNKFPNARVVWIIFGLNVLTGVAAGLVFNDLGIIVYSLVAIISSSYATDLIQRGFVSTFEVKIISSKPDEICDYIMNHLHRGVTSMKSKGMYTGEEHDYLICIIRKRQLSELKRAVKLIDDKSFMYITSVYDINGKGFNNTVTPTSKIK